MTVIPPRVLEIVSGFEQLEPILDDIEAEWRPDAAPLTTSMGDVGRAFAESAEALTATEVATVFDRIEALLREGTDEEKDAVATGFLEAVAAVLDELPERRWILQHAGKEAKQYMAEWGRFCGVIDD